jgi:hypothetical protein
MPSTLLTCTSSTRPAAPNAGDTLFETDTKKIITYSGTDWYLYEYDGTTAFVNTYSVSFDGTDDYVDFASDPGLNVKSISYWFNQAASKNTMIVSGLGGAAYTTYGGFGTDTSGKVRWNDGFAGGTSAASVFSYNTWNHYAAFHVPSGYTDSAGTATGNGAGWAVYVNNTRVDIQAASGTYGTTSVDTTNKFKIGREGERAGTYQFNGKVDEVALFTSSISASDVSDIYNSGVPTDISSLSPAAYWRMGDNDGGTGTTITDQGSGSNDGTLTNGPTFSTDVPT